MDLTDELQEHKDQLLQKNLITRQSQNDLKELMTHFTEMKKSQEIVEGDLVKKVQKL